MNGVALADDGPWAVVVARRRVKEIIRDLPMLLAARDDPKSDAQHYPKSARIVRELLWMTLTNLRRLEGIWEEDLGVPEWKDLDSVKIDTPDLVAAHKVNFEKFLLGEIERAKSILEEANSVAEAMSKTKPPRKDRRQIRQLVLALSNELTFLNRAPSGSWKKSVQ
jgi:hypothetical protein